MTDLSRIYQRSNPVLQVASGIHYIQAPRTGDVGYDLLAPHGFRLYPDSTHILKTTIRLLLPAGYFGMMCERSSLAAVGIYVHGGMPYTGEIEVIFHSVRTDEYEIFAGDKIAQLIILPYATPELVSVDRLPETERGGGGFGSTGR